MWLADTIGMVSGYAVVVLGLLVGWLGLRMMKNADSGAKKAGVGVMLLLALGMVGGGIWYGAVGHRFSKVDKASHRQAGEKVTKAIDRFGTLLTKCRDQVFPNMPYKPSEQAKAEKYVKAIAAMKTELLTCYTGSKGVGEEKGAELDQIEWLVADEDCKKFADKLINKRTFCPQVIETLVEKGGFIDPLKAAEGDEPAKPSADKLKAVDAELAKLSTKMTSCSKEILGLYRPPKSKDPAKASQEAVGAMMKAFKACAAGKDGESLDLATVKGLVAAADCKALAAKLKGMESCTPALEAPTKVGWTFAESAGGNGDQGDGKAEPRPTGDHGKKTGMEPAARPRPRAR